MAIWQISVFLENKPGELASITRVLSENHIDLRALTIAETSDYGILRLITDDTDRACGILLGAGFILSKNEVTAVTVPDEPGGLAKVLSVLADAGIDVRYMYSIFGKQQGSAHMIFRFDEPEKARAVLEEQGISFTDAAELGID